jgi:hypothetical protein
MTVEQIEQPNMSIVKFNVTDAEIAAMKNEYMGLTVSGIEDKEGLKKVYESRQKVKRVRVSLVKYADDLKESAIAWQKKVNTEKNRVVGELEAIEAHLQEEEDKIAAEKERIRQEAELKEQQRIQTRVDRLAEYGFAIDLSFIKSISDDDFEKVVVNAKIEHEKELAAKAEQARIAKEEAERLKAEREELGRLRKQQAEAQRIVDEQNARIKKEQEEKEAAILREQQKIENEKREIELQKQREANEKIRQAELEQARKDAAEKERLRIIAEQEQAKILEAEKLAQSSDKAKFRTVIDQLENVSIPEMKSKKAKSLSANVEVLITKIIDHINTSI